MFGILAVIMITIFFNWPEIQSIWSKSQQGFNFFLTWQDDFRMTVKEQRGRNSQGSPEGHRAGICCHRLSRLSVIMPPVRMAQKARGRGRMGWGRGPGALEWTQEDLASGRGGPMWVHHSYRKTWEDPYFNTRHKSQSLMDQIWECERQAVILKHY